MPDMQEHTVVKKRTHAANGVTALFSALRRQKHGLALGLYRVKANRLSLPDVDLISVKGHANLPIRYRKDLDQSKSCRIIIADAGVRDRVYMDVDSLAFLLDAAVASNPSHFLRRTHAAKDSDE